MKKKMLYFQFLILILFSQCAYYNTFYYAKYYFKKAYRETRKNITGKISSNEKNNYQKAIEKGNRLLVMYPNSKYVDDALLLLGKSHYFRSEYPQARRRLNYLLTRFSKSELLPEARLWLAKVDIEQERFESAKNSLETLIASKPGKQIQGQAYFYLAKIHGKKEEFEKAISFYKNAYDADIDEIKTDALFAIGADYDTLGVYDLAAQYFLKAMKSASAFEMRSESQYRYAMALKKMGKIDEAIRLYEVLLVDERNKNNFGNYRLRIGEALVSKGDIEGAILTYRDITDEFKRKVQSAEAYYALGKLFETYKKDYDKAAEYYAKVRAEYRQSVFIDSAETRKRDIQRMTALQQVIRMAITGEEGEIVEIKDDAENLVYQDSTVFDESFQDNYAQQDSSQQETTDPFQDTNEIMDVEDPFLEQGVQNTDPDREGYGDREREQVFEQTDRNRNGVDPNKPAIVENPELKSFKKEELDKNLLLLGELYLLRFALLDSAANQYRMLIDRFPESPYSPQAHYNLCYVYSELNQTESTDSCYRELINKYPSSPYANAVREKIGVPSKWTREDTVKAIFHQAEYTLFDDKDSENAFQIYKEIVSKYPDSQLAPKAAYTLGWIAETRFDSLNLAYALYDSLISQYPESVQAKAAQRKVQSVTAYHKNEKKKEETESDSLQQIRTFKQPVTHDSLESEDALPEIVESDTLTDSLKTTSHDIFIQNDDASLPSAEPIGGMDALKARITNMLSTNRLSIYGEFQCQVLVDTIGQVEDIRILKNPNPNADELLTMLIKGTRFKPINKENQTGSDWMSLNIQFTAVENNRRR